MKNHESWSTAISQSGKPHNVFLHQFSWIICRNWRTFPLINFSNSIVESWSTSISKWGNQIRKSVSHTFQVNKWCWNHILFVRDPFRPYDERLCWTAELRRICLQVICLSRLSCYLLWTSQNICTYNSLSSWRLQLGGPIRCCTFVSNVDVLLLTHVTHLRASPATTEKWLIQTLLDEVQ